MTKKPPPITPPPSLDEIVAAETDERLGRVDFGAPLVPPDEPEGAEAEPGPMIRRAPTTAAERLAAPAEKPADKPVDEPAHEPAPDTDATEDDDPIDGEQRRAAFEAAVRARVHDLTSSESAGDPSSAAESETAPPPQPPVTVIGAPDEGLHHLDQTVDDVARAVIARMREAGEANRRHLEALETEAARRLELLTAQAELDAELIRLHARREAHAIVTAARLRTGGRKEGPYEDRQLSAIGETFSRFTESLEAVDDLPDDLDDHDDDEEPADPDHPHGPWHR